MPTCRNMFAMPKVRASSATIGTTRGPTSLSLSSAVSMRTSAIVVDISRPFESSANCPQEDIGGTISPFDATFRLLGR